jgi:hypothetical protein
MRIPKYKWDVYYDRIYLRYYKSCSTRKQARSLVTSLRISSLKVLRPKIIRYKLYEPI